MAKLKALEQVAAWRSIYPAPCQAACPIHTDARKYVTLVGQGRFDEAFWAAREFNPLVAICGRVCSAPCEDVCTRGEFDRPIPIRQLKRFLSDHFETRPVGQGRPPAAGQRVAIIGAGPAGLTVAHELARRGYAVTIYEATEAAGGMPALGVPRFRLSMDAIARDVRAIEALGVTIERGVHVGRDVSLDQLLRESDALFIASGAARSNMLSAPGVDLAGVVQALPYLKEANLGGRPQTGRRVAVIGGGYTAMDASRTAVRLGAEQVTVLYRRTWQETEVNDDERRAALDEGVHIEYLVSPLELVDDGKGRVGEIICIRNELGDLDLSGRRRPLAIPGSEFRFPVDMVILALGQQPDPQDLGSGWLDLLRQVNPETMMTPIQGLFAGGDFVSGPTTIIEAVREGRAAADAIDTYLRALTERPTSSTSVAWPIEVIPRLVSDSRNGNSRPDRGKGLALDCEVELSLTAETAVSEGLRCLYCGLPPSIVFQDCTICHACVQVCPVDCIRTVAIDEESGVVRPATSFREAVSYDIDAELCIRCGRCFKACPVGAIVVEVQLN